MSTTIKTETGKLKILIMSAPIGSGHRMAALALEEALSCLENVEVIQGNVFDFFPAAAGSLFLTVYGKILTYFPSLYACSYRWGNQNSGSLRLRNLINRILMLLGKSFISGVDPDVVLSTHATPTGIFSLYKRQYNPKFWLGVVVTDFTVHRWLICPGVDAYFLADRKLFGQITGSGTDSDGKPELFAYGIPVRKMFREQNEIAAVRKKLRKDLGWKEDAFVCLLAGGGGGMLPMEKVVKEISGSKLLHLHIIAVTGHNESLNKKLKAMTGTDTVKVLGFTEDMPLLMQGADLVITKAGGVSIAECLACGAKTVIYKPLPGQESMNTQFLENGYGIKVAKDIRGLINEIKNEMRVPVSCRIAGQETRKKSFGCPEAAKYIAGVVDKLR